MFLILFELLYREELNGTKIIKFGPLGLDNSKDVKQEFLEKVKNQHKLENISAIVIYEINKNQKDSK
ncbi:hypothetical protein C2G38_2236438 [Gigaspora rosea]|uniref:Uncharacterized protein n=1 Tax=Gigaspora rosea TaxID=44941 RepID=A0A397TPN7_9GLOM|nr:hypothetical protein C2G38_2236438 [Gigaspora rosea]